MAQSNDTASIAEDIGPAVSSLGLELYDVEITGSGRATVVRVLIDREGGVDLDAITRATDAITPILDSESLASRLPTSYALEVSSPGLERPLRRPQHFRGAIGTEISIKFHVADAPTRRIRGVVVAVDDEGCEVALDGGGTERIGFGDVVQARTVFEWGPQPKPGKKEVARR